MIFAGPNGIVATDKDVGYWKYNPVGNRWTNPLGYRIWSGWYSRMLHHTAVDSAYTVVFDREPDSFVLYRTNDSEDAGRFAMQWMAENQFQDEIELQALAF